MFFGRFSPQKQKTISSYQKNLNHQQFRPLPHMPQDSSKCFGTLSKMWKQCPPKSGTISEPSTSSFTSPHNGIPRPHEVSLPNFLLRGHGRKRPPPHPRPPSPRGAAQPWIPRPNSAAWCSGVLPREPQPEAKPGTKGEKLWENFDASKVKFWKLWPLKNPPWTSGTLWFWGCFDDIELVEKGMWTRLAVKMLCGNFKKCSISKKTNMCGYACHWDTTEFEISPLR